MKENLIIGFLNRTMQIFARFLPGAKSIRVVLHRMRGIHIGKDVWIGYDNIFETAHPDRIYIGNDVTISMRVMMIAHFDYSESNDEEYIRENKHSIRIEDDVFIGPGVIILPHVVIGQGAVVTAGSVVNRAIPPLTMVRGNPAKPIARCGIPLTREIRMKTFMEHLRKLD